MLIQSTCPAGSTGAYQKILRKVDLPVIPNPECQSRLRQTRLGPFFRLHNSFVCAGGEAGRDTCQVSGGAAESGDTLGSRDSGLDWTEHGTAGTDWGTCE